ncbi:MAG: ParA family protein [Anaerolineae bacterium]|nr:ParA family protein [Anaerolineae bacterium]
MAVCIAISSQKGGVAKTTTCLSLGACLAELGQLVLLIDLDPQTNLTLSVGLNPAKLRYTVSEALLGNASLVSISREGAAFGLDIVPASSDLAVLGKVLHGRPDAEFYLERGLEAMDDDLYDVILVDCPPSFGLLTLNALTAADLLIIPTQCEYYAAHALRRTIELAELVRKKTNPHLLYRVLVTMYDQRNRICQAILERMRKGLDGLLFETIIEVDTKLRESPVFGEPITLYAPQTRGAQQYRALAKELMRNG